MGQSPWISPLHSYSLSAFFWRFRRCWSSWKPLVSWHLTCVPFSQNFFSLLVSWVVTGPVILCWCLALQFRIKRETYHSSRMVVHRYYFCISSSCLSFVSMVTASTSLMTVASACVSLVRHVTLSGATVADVLTIVVYSTTGLLSRINDHLGFRDQQGCLSFQRFANGCNSCPDLSISISHKLFVISTPFNPLSGYTAVEPTIHAPDCKSL